MGTTSRLAPLLGEQFVTGGVHPRFGTRNAILPLTDDTYFEVVEVLDHPASDKAPFGQAVRARSELGGGWLGWAVAVDDIRPHEARLGREAVNGNRHRPDGTELLWKQLGVQGPPGRPAAAVLHRVGRRPLAAPERRCHRQRVAGVPRDRRRPGPRLGVARPVGRRAARGREGRVGRPQRHSRDRRRAVPDPQRARPHLIRRGRSRPRSGRHPEPEHLEPPAGLRGREPRGRPRRRDHLVDAAPRPVGGPRPARHRLRHRLPPARSSPRRRAPSSGSSRTATWPRSPGVGYAACPTSTVLHGSAEALPLPDDVGRRDARALGLLLRPGVRARTGRARPGDAPGLAGVRDRQRPDPVDVRRVVPAGLPRRSTTSRRPRSGPSWAGSDTGSTWRGPSTRARTSSPSYASSSRRPWPTRSSPGHEGTSVDYAVNVWTRTWVSHTTGGVAPVR